MRFRTATLFTLLPVLARAADAPLFAATVQQAAPTSTGGALRVIASLAIVILAVFAAAWLAKRLRRLQVGGGSDIELLAQVTLSNRERAVLMKVGEERLLVGVASGGVTLLHRFDRDAVLPGEGTKSSLPVDPNRPNFAALLKKGLGL